MNLAVQFIFSISAILLVVGFNQISMAEDPGWQAAPELINAREAAEKKRSQQFNYREENVPDFMLPNPLVCADGSKVHSKSDWLQKRRPEILELFRKHVYGRAPLEAPPGQSFHLKREDKKALNGAATLKIIQIKLANDPKAPSIKLILFVPNKTQKPAPAFLLMSHRDASNLDPDRNIKKDFWPVEQIIKRGYAAAAFAGADVDPDNHDEFKNGVHGYFDARSGRTPDAWGTLCAWAWGASRCMDYLVTDDDIAAKKVAVIGHSRGGKTALWAGARDPRFQLVVSNDSGCGGAALSRRRYGETVARINKVFPHWFCDNFNHFNDREDELPVDQHMLVALIAPRLVSIASANEDLWADPHGEFLSAKAASPVYRLLGVKGLEADAMPPVDQPRQNGRIGYYIRSGKHNLNLIDWNHHMDFADKHWK